MPGGSPKTSGVGAEAAAEPGSGQRGSLAGGEAGMVSAVLPIAGQLSCSLKAHGSCSDAHSLRWSMVSYSPPLLLEDPG